MISLIETNTHNFSIVKTLTVTAILVILGILIPGIYKNEPTMWINIVVSVILYFTIMMFESICYPLASALIMDIILHQTIPNFDLKGTIFNYSIMIIAFASTLMIYNFLFREIIEDAKKYLFKIKKLGYIIASYTVYFLTLSLWKDAYSWKSNNLDTINILIIVLAMLITSFSISFFIILIINSISKYRKLTQENEKEIKEERNQQEPIYQNILDNIPNNKAEKTRFNIKNQKFKHLENDVQNYIDTIQPFNDYEPQKRVLNALYQAIIDIQHIAQNYENRQKINDPNMINHYLEQTYLKQAEQVKENAKDLCNEFLDYVEQYKDLSSKEDMKNIQTILKKLNNKGE